MKLSREQQYIVDWNILLAVLIVTAKAGTGKTTTACELIHKRLAEGLRVLALTFTRNGTGELAQQLNDAYSTGLVTTNGSVFQAHSPSVTLSTFDSQLRRELRGMNIAEIDWETASSNWVCEQLYTLAGAKLCETHPKWFKYSCLISRIEELYSIMATGGALRPSIVKTLEPYWSQIMLLAESSRLLLPGQYAELVSRHREAIAAKCLANYDFVVVDECQDTSRHELSVLASLASNVRMVCLGDPGQNLMAFRGAVGDLAAEFRQLNVRYESAKLSVNQRSLAKLVIGQNSLQLANEWKGPLATHARKGCSSGVEPLYVTGNSEEVLLSAVQELLVGLFPSRWNFDPDGSSHEFDAFIAASASVLSGSGSFSVDHTPSLEILVPTNDAGRTLESALRERGLDIPFLQAGVNPFETKEALLLQSWCDPGRDNIWTDIQLVVEAHFRRQRRSDLQHQGSEVLAIFNALMMACDGARNVCGAIVPLGEALQMFIKWVQVCMNDPRIQTVDAIRYCQELLAVCTQWTQMSSQGLIEPMLDALGSVTLNIGRSPRRGGVSIGAPAMEPWIVSLARSRHIEPSAIRDWIRTCSILADRTHGDSLRGVFPCIKTISRSKGDTVDISILYRADKIPWSTRESMLQSPKDRLRKKQDDLGVEYVAMSRARFVHVQLALNHVGSHHEPRLKGWVYQSISDASGR